MILIVPEAEVTGCNDLLPPVSFFLRDRDMAFFLHFCLKKTEKISELFLIFPEIGVIYSPFCR